MLYGNLTFIKKTGGDGSKYPVTERNIKIGRSENCLIRIYNPHVALEHCQLIIEDNGQAVLRNLSNQSILGGKPSSNGDVTLCHGDIFKLGERLARWEYLPTSKFYKQLLSPTGRLVAVVIPQQRSLGDQATPGTSASEFSALKNTTLGKRRFSERATLENSGSVKIRKSNGSEFIYERKRDLQNLLTGHNSLKSAKWIKGAKVKERKSISGIVGSKTSKGKVLEKYRKSTLPSWKVNILSPSGRKSSGNRNSLSKSNQEEAKSPKNAVEILLKDMIKSKPEKLLLSNSKNEVKRPQKINLKSNLLDDSVKTGLKKSVMTEKESLLNLSERSTRAHSFSQSLENANLKSSSKVVSFTPNQNLQLKSERLVHSESKLISKKSSVLFKGKRKLNFILDENDFTSRQILNKRGTKQKKSDTSKIEISDNSDGIVVTPVKSSEVVMTKGNDNPQKSLKKISRKITPKKSEKISKKSIGSKTLKSPDVKTPRKSVIMKTPRSLSDKKQSKTQRINILRNDMLDTMSQAPPLSDLNDTPSSKRSKIFNRESMTAKKTPIKSSENSEKIRLSSSSQKIQNKTDSLVSSSPIDNFKLNSSQTLTSRSRNSLKASTGFPRGGPRKLSPSSSAERAAKKLKISCPKKPDKNKKAALLVLGKANRKQQVSQNVKVLLRQKILKKAIKQSTAVSVLDDKIGIRTANKLKKGSRKNTSEPKPKKFRKKNKSNDNSSLPKYLQISNETDLKSPTAEKTKDGSPKDKILANNVFQTSPSLPPDAKVQTVSRQIRQSEFSNSDNFDCLMEKRNSASSVFDKNADNYFFNSNRRCSKRLSYKNDTGRPDFIELSPTALGLIPKNIEIFKTPKGNKRRSSSLVTSKNAQTAGIIKSASTSKIGSRKSVRFSSKDVSINSGFCSPNVSERIDFNFSPFDTPNITVDVFVSPLMDQSAVLNQNLNESTVTPERIVSNPNTSIKSNSVPKTLVSKPQSPSFKKKLHKTFLESSKLSQSFSASTFNSLSSIKVEKQSNAYENRSRKSDLNDPISSRQLLLTPKNKKSSKNNLLDLTGVCRTLCTPNDVKSLKNDIIDVERVKKLMRTPKVQKSPKNDLTDVRGVKKLMRTPKVQKSPKNDLTDVRGVKKLMRTPKVKKSPKNDLTDVRGVKKLMRTPKVQKSPKNDLTNVTGVMKLFTTPLSPRSSENSTLGASKTEKPLESPLVLQVSKNSVGYDEILSSQSKKNINKSVKNAKMNELLISKSSESVLKSKKNVTVKSHVKDFRAIRGRRAIHLRSKRSKNDLSDLTGIRELFSRHKPTSDYNISLTGVAELFEFPKTEVSCDREVTNSGKKLIPESVQRMSKTRTLRSKKILKNDVETKSCARLRARKAVKEIEKKPTRSKKLEAIMNLEEEKLVMKKTANEMKANRAKAVVKKSPKVAKKKTKTSGKKSLAKTKVESSEEDQSRKRSLRKRKIFEDVGISPPKLRRKVPPLRKSTSNTIVESSEKAISRSRTGRATRKETSLKRVQKVQMGVNDSETATVTSKVPLKTTIKIGTNRIEKVQNKRSQTKARKSASNNKEKESPRKTRSKNAITATKKISKTKSKSTEKKVVKRTAGKEKSSPVAKRSTRRK